MYSLGIRILAVVAFIASSAVINHASAKPPGWEFYGSFRVNFMACQEQSDLKAILDLRNAKGIGESSKLFAQLTAEKAKNGYYKCFYGNVGPVQVGNNVDLGTRALPSGKLVHEWLVNVGNSQMGFWLFWNEAVAGSAISYRLLPPRHWWNFFI